MVLFADDTSIIINSINQTEFEDTVNKIFQSINEWFTSVGFVNTPIDKPLWKVCRP